MTLMAPPSNPASNHFHVMSNPRRYSYSLPMCSTVNKLDYLWAVSSRQDNCSSPCDPWICGCFVPSLGWNITLPDATGSIPIQGQFERALWDMSRCALSPLRVIPDSPPVLLVFTHLEEIARAREVASKHKDKTNNVRTLFNLVDQETVIQSTPTLAVFRFRLPSIPVFSVLLDELITRYFE